MDKKPMVHPALTEFALQSARDWEAVAQERLGVIERLCAEVQALRYVVVPIDIESPDYSYQGMGCGLEDRGITDRYEAMAYGFEQAVEAYQQIIANYGQLYVIEDKS